MHTGLVRGTAAHRVFCGVVRATRRLPPIRLSSSARQELHRRDPRETLTLPLERPWLRAARTKLGLRLLDVARQLGLAPPTLLRLEQRTCHRTTERRALQLQKLLGLTDAQRVELTTTVVTRWS